MELTLQDDKYLAKLRMDSQDIMQQSRWLRSGPAYLSLVAPCTQKHGIWVLASEDQRRFDQLFINAQPLSVSAKFVPASGAATRMFHALIEQAGKSDPALLNQESEKFFQVLSRFPFWPALKKYFSTTKISVEERLQQKQFAPLLQALLYSPGLNLAQRPKGLVEFHRYGSEMRTAFIEHLYEGKGYLLGGDDRARFHFTVPEAHRGEFQTACSKLQQGGKGEFSRWDIQFSVQDTRTHTLAIDTRGDFIRDSQGQLALRPGGHGALLNNLATMTEDFIFIKNIDNVARQEDHQQIAQMQRILGGVLLECQGQISYWLKKIPSVPLGENEIIKLESFLLQTLGTSGSQEARSRGYLHWVAWLQEKLSRPLRVCGMVKNQGEPGGGPFWVRMADGSLSKQIVEASQTDPNDSSQQKIFAAATHFNPVNLVCNFKDPRGRPYPLEKYCDPNAYFTTQKNVDGKTVQILERPGLWNGAMAFWNTVFVEVPLNTFCPVKSVFDLLRPEHLGGPF